MIAINNNKATHTIKVIDKAYGKNVKTLSVIALSSQQKQHVDRLSFLTVLLSLSFCDIHYHQTINNYVADKNIAIAYFIIIFSVHFFNKLTSVQDFLRLFKHSCKATALFTYFAYILTRVGRTAIPLPKCVHVLIRGLTERVENVRLFLHVSYQLSPLD